MIGKFGHPHFVNGPLIRWHSMTEQIRGIKFNEIVAPAIAVITLFIIIGQMVFGAGGIFSRDTVNAAHFQVQLDSLSTQLSRLSDKIDNGPRADQLQEMIRHLSAQDGRLDSFDARLRALEAEEAATAARIQH
jgi:hypothetical protein